MSAVLVLKPVNVYQDPLLEMPIMASTSSTSAKVSNNNPPSQDVEDRKSKRSHRRSKYRQRPRGVQVNINQSSPVVPKTHDESPTEKIMRLEGNLHFLTENYQQMLSGLHREIQTLTSKNQELQFQLVTGLTLKLNVKDDNGDNRVANSQNAQLKKQISSLRKDVEQLQHALRDANERNAYYKNLVEELKRHRKSSSPESKDELTGAVASWSAKHFSELPLPFARRFKEYEDTIQRLRSENDVLKEEITRQEQDRNGDHRRLRCATRLPRIDQHPGRQQNAKH